MTSTPADLLNAALAQVGKLRNALGELVPLDLSDIVTPLATWPAGRLVVAPGQIASSAWGNTTYDQTVVTFNSAADRDSQWPAPHEGSVCFLNDVKRMQMFANGAWAYKDLRVSRYKVLRSANGLASGGYNDVGAVPNNEWCNGSQIPANGANATRITMLKPSLVLISGALSGAVAVGLVGSVTTPAFAVTYGAAQMQGNAYQTPILYSGVLNTGETLDVQARNGSGAAINFASAINYVFADINAVLMQ